MENRFMRRAIELSLDNVRRGQGGPFAALVVKEGEILASGTNQVTSMFDPTAHAEVVAIREACRKLSQFQLPGCEIYTTCEPCPMCLGAIYWARPAKVYFGNTAADAAAIGFDDSFIYQQLGVPLSDRSVPMIPLMREEALAAFREWELKTDKVPY
jgi:guanine deaminase